MLNRYPLWKNLMVVFALAIGLFYALPNVYGEDPAIQITGARGAPVALAAVDTITNDLKRSNITYQSIAFVNNAILVRFEDTEDQIRARDELNRLLGKDYIVALNLAAATPDWVNASTWSFINEINGEMTMVKP